MDAPKSSQPLTAQVKLNVTSDGLPPSHHVLAPAPGTTLSSYIPHWNPQPATWREEQRPDSTQSTQALDDDYSSNAACLPNSIALVDSSKVVRTGFRNPWPSWHKPSVTEVWQGLEWGEDRDPAIEYAMQDADLGTSANAGTNGDASVLSDPYTDSRPGTPDLEDASLSREGAHADRGTTPQSISSAAPYTRQQKIKMASKQLLTVESPSFDFDSDAKLKATWLGHAGVLVQLPPLSSQGQPVRVLFDPIFSQRCSPTQVAGPIRSYAAPCAISSLPPVDLVVISHNHYDHLDYETIRQLWAANQDRIRFVVPLGNKEWFIGANASSSEADLERTATSSTSWSWTSAGSGVMNATTTSNLAIPPERVTELDWWDEVLLRQRGDEDRVLRVVCTPAQHGSGRYGVDTNCALWSSWFLEHPGRSDAGAPTKIYFGGDTGCQFHGPSFPPAPPQSCEPDVATDTTHTGEVSSISDDATLPGSACRPTRTRTYQGGTRLQVNDERNEPNAYPGCPAFEEIVARLGRPDFVMLPISVGATISFVRSYMRLPDSISPIPRISCGLTAANHMPPWDAVSVFDKMSDASQNPVALAIHWGTFICGPDEVLKTLGQLKWACHQHAIHFARSQHTIPRTPHSLNQPSKSFVALNHGASISL